MAPNNTTATPPASLSTTFDPSSLGGRIRSARTHKAMSAASLGKLIGTSGVSIVNWENGKHQPKIYALEKIARVLDCPLADLLNGYSSAQAGGDHYVI